MPQLAFARPELLVLLALVPVLVWSYVALFAARRRALSVFAGRGAGLVSRSGSRLRAKAALVVVAAAAVVIALAGPQTGVREREIVHRGVDVVVALDVSQSMAVRDVAPDRLRAAASAIETLARVLEGNRVALVLYAGEAVVRYPSTTKPEVLKDVLENSGRGFRLPGGSSLKAAIQAGFETFPAAVRDGPQRKALIVVSDGEDPSGVPPDLAPLRDRNVRIFTVGVGTPEGGQIPIYGIDGSFFGMLRGRDDVPITSRLDEPALRAIADAGGGSYRRLTGENAVRALANDVRALDASELATDSGVVADDRYQIFVALALLAVLAEWAISDRRRMPTPGPLRYGLARRRPGTKFLGDDERRSEERSDYVTRAREATA